MAYYIPYEIISTEAAEAEDLIDTPGYPLEGLAELGPQDEAFMGDAITFPYELRAMIMVEKLLPGPRTIRLIHNGFGWTYRCKSPPNQVPFVVHGLNGMMAPLVTYTLRPAPLMRGNEYPWFNYGLDTLFFEYLSCEASPLGNPKYVTAMKEVSDFLREHNNKRHELEAPVRRIKITWCHNESLPQPILDRFRGIRHREKITLVAHDHYTHAFPDKVEEYVDYSNEDSDQDDDDVGSEPEDTSTYNFMREHEIEPVDMRAMVRAGDLNGSSGERTRWRRYPFKVELIDHNGDPVLYWDDEDAYHAAN